MAKKRDERHRYGQHYTPLEVAELLAAFAVRSETEQVLDPSCGDGRLLSEVLLRVNDLNRRPARAAHYLAPNLFGIDLSEGAVKLAAQTGARVARADFLELEPGARVNGGIKLPLRFDVIIGNPPYIRQELMGARDKRRAEKRLERDRFESPEISWPPWSGRSDMYVYFFAHSTRFLKPDGRLVFLTASSWLDAGYGAPLRDFLRNNFRITSIIESAAESFFADASVNTIITVLDRETDQSKRNANPVRFVQLNRPLVEALSANGHKKAAEFARSIEQESSSTALDTHRIRVLAQSELPHSETGWSRYLRAEDAFFRVIERAGAKLKELSTLARVRYGVKTGANDFFYVKDAWLLPLAEVASVRRGITTGANEFFYVCAVGNSQAGETVIVEDKFGVRHRIEARFLSPVVFSLKEISGIVLDKTRAAKLFFNCANPPGEIAGTHAFDYVSTGERAGYHLRPTCRARSPWYGVARGRKAAPLIFPSKVGERWVVALNRDGVFEDKKLYGVFPRKGVSTGVLAALLNSTWARYYAELTCRQMTGAQAIADIDVIVAERILLPDPRELSAEIKKELQAALRMLSSRPIFSIFEEVNHLDRRKLDDLVLSAIGFSTRPEREALLDNLYEAVTKLVRERLEKAVKRGK